MPFWGQIPPPIGRIATAEDLSIRRVRLGLEQASYAFRFSGSSNSSFEDVTKIAETETTPLCGMIRISSAAGLEKRLEIADEMFRNGAR